MNIVLNEISLSQKSFGKSIACPKCSMLYVLGVEEDEKNHRKHCRSRQHLHIDSLSIESLRHEWESQAQESVSVSLSPHNSDSSWQDTSSSRSSSGSVHVVWEDVQQKVCIIKVRIYTRVRSTFSCSYNVMSSSFFSDHIRRSTWTRTFFETAPNCQHCVGEP